MHHPTRQTVFLVGLSAGRTPALGISTALYSLAGRLKADHGNDVRISLFDMYADHSIGIDDICHGIQCGRPSILGLSLIPGSLEKARKLYQKAMGLPAPSRPLIVCGSSIANAFPTLLLSGTQLPGVVVVLGEGEEPLSAIVLARKCGKPLTGIPGTTMETKNGFIVSTPPAKPYRLAEQPPPDLQSLVATSKRTGADVYLVGSHGCPYDRCSFCTGGRTSYGSVRSTRGWQGKEVTQVAREVEFLMSEGIRFFKFADEEFVGPGARGVERATRLAKAIQDTARKANRRLDFSMSCRVDSLWGNKDSLALRRRKAEMLRELAKAGLVKVFLGVESGSKTQLERLNKGHSVDESERAIAMVRGAEGVRLEVGWIMLDPQVTVQELKDNMTFIRRTRIEADIAWFLNPLSVIEGSRCARLYRDDPQVTISEAPDMDTLRYEYSFTDLTVRYLTKRVLGAFKRLNNQLHALRREIHRAGENGRHIGNYSERRRTIIHRMTAGFERVLNASSSDTDNIVSGELAELRRQELAVSKAIRALQEGAE